MRLQSSEINGLTQSVRLTRSESMDSIEIVMFRWKYKQNSVYVTRVAKWTGHIIMLGRQDNVLTPLKLLRT